jgi:hypothetical protein
MRDFLNKLLTPTGVQMLDELASEMKLTSPELLKLMGLGAILLTPNAIETPDRAWLERYFEIFSPKYMSLPSGEPRQWQTSWLELNPNVEPRKIRNIKFY